MSTTERRRARKIDAILHHATELALEGGLESVTIHGLAKAMDYTPGALYRYFPSKAELLAALHLRLVGYLSERLEDAWETAGRFAQAHGLNEDQHAGVQLLAVTVAMAHFASEEAGPFRIIAASFAHPRHMLEPESAQAAASAYIELIVAISRPIEHLQQRDVFTPGDAVQRAIILLTSTNSLLQLQKVTRLAPDIVNAEALASGLALGLIRGWTSEPRTFQIGPSDLAKLFSFFTS